jgi:hypothetical protein
VVDAAILTATEAAQIENRAGTTVETEGPPRNGTRDEIIVTTDEEGMMIKMMGGEKQMTFMVVMVADGEGTGAETTGTQADTTTTTKTTTTVIARGGRISVIGATVCETTATAVTLIRNAEVLLGVLRPLDALVHLHTQRPLRQKTRRNLTLPHRACSQLRRTRSRTWTGRALCSNTTSLLRLVSRL